MATKFNKRAFTSLFLLWSFIILTISGVVVFIAPPGRIANWVVWRFLGLTKDQWEALHSIFGYLFVIAGVYHLVLNWKAIVHYVRRKLKERKKIKAEFTTSIIVTLVLFVLILLNVPPFSTIMSLSESAKDMWSEKYESPPVPHTELMTLKEFAREMNIPMSRVTEILEANGVESIEPDSTISWIATVNGLTPQEFYNLFEPELEGSGVEEPVSTSHSTGLGQKTIRQLCQEEGVDVKAAIERLRGNGIEAAPDETVRDVAARNGMRPYEIADIISGR